MVIHLHIHKQGVHYARSKAGCGPGIAEARVTCLYLPPSDLLPCKPSLSYSRLAVVQISILFVLSLLLRDYRDSFDGTFAGQQEVAEAPNRCPSFTAHGTPSSNGMMSNLPPSGPARYAPGPKKRRRIHLNCEECRRTKSRCRSIPPVTSAWTFN